VYLQAALREEMRPILVAFFGENESKTARGKPRVDIAQDFNAASQVSH